jgi:hypothetical protein
LTKSTKVFDEASVFFKDSTCSGDASMATSCRL